MNILKKEDTFFIILGCIGALIVLYGQTLHTPPQVPFIFGSFLLFCTAIYFNLLFFIATELILMAGHATIYFNLGPYLQFAIPVLLTVQIIIYYFVMGQRNNLFLYIGLTGTALLAVDFTYHEPLIYFLGAMCIATYAFYCIYHGLAICYIWACLNSIFAAIALYYLYIG